MPRREWSREEQLLALGLYCLLPFGKLHQSNSDVMAVAEAIHRTPSAVAMKACNFASLDPALERQGLGNVSRADRELWEAFQNDSESIAAEAVLLNRKLIELNVSQDETLSYKTPVGETESIQQVRVRRVQGFFRKAVLVGYNYKCALSGLRIPELLIASHIIPWSVDVSRRADPTNGIVLNALYDRAFDKGFITFDDEYRVVVSKELDIEMVDNKEVMELFNIEHKSLHLPTRFRPDTSAINYHRENIFRV